MRASLKQRLLARAYVLKRLIGQGAVQRRAPTGRRVLDLAAPAEQGALDAVRGGVASGWARRLDALAQPVEVDLYVDGRFVGRALADLPRPDLARLAGFRAGGRHGFTHALSPGAALAGRELRAYAAASGLELLGSPLRLDHAAQALPRPVRRQLRRLTRPAPLVVTLADQAHAYGRRLAVLVEPDPRYPDADRPVSRAMGYVNARLHGDSLTAEGVFGFFDLFDASAQHFASAPAGLPVGADLLAALTATAAHGPLGSYLLESLRLRAGLDAAQDTDPLAKLAGFALDYLYTRRLPLELLGPCCRAWLGQDPSRWDLALREVDLLAPATKSIEALRAAADHVGLTRALRTDPGPPNSAATPRPGVRVVSADYGDSGLALNTRHSLDALQALGVEHDHVSMNLQDLRASRWTEPDVRETVLVHAQPDDAVELILRLPAAQSQARLIGFYMWETERAPPWFSLGLRLVDEIWTGSRFCADAFAAEAAPAPIRVVGHAVRPAAPEPGFDARAFAGAPEGVFLAYTHFDARSWITRKNPGAAARAFRRAFPQGDEAAVLLVKTRGQVSDPTEAARAAWAALREQADADPRIRLVDADLGAGALSAVMQASDAYLSLHRGEGFGYGPAEAVLAGAPLVVSAYGGPLDFCEGAWLVPCRRREVLPGEFVATGAGQTWGEPDVETAARHLRAIYEDPAGARRRAALARSALSGQLSLEALAGRYRTALA